MRHDDDSTLSDDGHATPSDVGLRAMLDGGDGDMPRRLGRFRIERQLGRGGMGQVFEAWDPRLSRHVAIKLVRRGDPQMLERFRREALAQASLSHPSICPVYEVGEQDGVPFIVMQRFDGAPLDEAAESLPLDAKLRLMRQIAEAVHEAHRAGLIHRDLKPNNVLVELPEGEPPRPFVLDFGLARSVGDTLGAHFGETMTEEGAVLGTPAYMAPEQLRGALDALGARTDVYSLGATLYHLLAGHPPFRGLGPTFLLDALERDPPSLRAAGVPREVEHIVFKCLEKEPARRYASAAAFAEDLRRYLDGETIEARPAGPRVRLAKWVRRHRPLAAALAALLVTIVMAIAWNVVSDQRAQRQATLVRAFVEDVETMAAEVRFSHMAPLHDIRSDRARLRARMERIRDDMAAHPDLDVGAGYFALGFGHLALEAFDDAYRAFEAAWDAGYRPQDTATALVRVLSALYREQLSDVDLVRDVVLRQARLDALE
ncbi:MAG: serine/threonine-protein kinase, partial [Acidobacteriota bacterium]